MSSEDRNRLIRLAAFQWLRAQADVYGDELPRPVLAVGFQFGDARVPLLGPQGIFKPAILTDAPLSITTAPNGPYADSLIGRLLRYAYRGMDPGHPDNRGLRRAMAEQIPLVYFFGLRPGFYTANWPVYIVGDRPNELFFDVAVDDPQFASAPQGALVEIAEDRTEIRREYITAEVRRRLHQQAFRARVIEAYRVQCALCRLRHQELLDAAHITADAHPEGEPVVSNGLSLCKLHHAAYDRNLLTVRPDYIIEVRQSVLDEQDGPMLLHGLKGMHRQLIVLPRAESQRPDRDRLEQRYAAFRTAV
jgi:putative restriction endonuclease